MEEKYRGRGQIPPVFLYFILTFHSCPASRWSSGGGLGRKPLRSSDRLQVGCTVLASTGAATAVSPHAQEATCSAAPSTSPGPSRTSTLHCNTTGGLDQVLRASELFPSSDSACQVSGIRSHSQGAGKAASGMPPRAQACSLDFTDQLLPRCPPPIVAVAGGEMSCHDVPSARFFCRFPGCDKGYASTDAVRKHCRQRHLQWLTSFGEKRGPGLYCRWDEEDESAAAVLARSHKRRADGLGGTISDVQVPFHVGTCHVLPATHDSPRST